MAQEGAVSVYAGKGPNEVHAKVSSIMEAIERYSAEMQDDDETIIKEYDPCDCLNPEDLILPRDVYDGQPLEWTKGYSIKTGEEVLIPSNAVYHPYNTEDITHIFYSNTNGLASGNTIEEAIFHGMMEVVERDAWSFLKHLKKRKRS